MKKIEIVASLVNIANDLDTQKLYDEADVMTKIAYDMAKWQGDDDYNPNDYAEMGEDRWLGEQALQHNVNLDNDMEERRRYVSNPDYESNFADEIPNQVLPRHKAEQLRKELQKAKTPNKPLYTSINRNLIGKDDQWLL